MKKIILKHNFAGMAILTSLKYILRMFCSVIGPFIFITHGILVGLFRTDYMGANLNTNGVNLNKYGANSNTWGYFEQEMGEVGANSNTSSC